MKKHSHNLKRTQDTLMPLKSVAVRLELTFFIL